MMMMVMGAWPVIERELRVGLLRRGARERWLHTARSAAAMTLVILVFQGFFGQQLHGRTLFGLLFAGGCYTAVRFGIQITSDLFSEERRNGTLGLLVLTGLRPLEIFASKLAGVGLTTLYQLAVGLPFLGVAFVMGGVQFNQFIGAAAFLLAVIALCTALGTLGSVLCRDGGLAQITAIGMLLFLAAVPYLAARIGGGTMNWRTLSPVFGVLTIYQAFPSGDHEFWRSISWLLAIALIAVLLGALILHATWRENSILAAPGWSPWGRWSGRRRVTRRVEMLRRSNPFCWLAARDATPVRVVSALMAGLLIVWFGGWAWEGSPWLKPGRLVVTSLVLHLILNWGLAYAAARTIALERHEGGLELLLTTPLTGPQIVEGQHRALLIQFAGVLLAVFSIDLILCAAGYLLLVGRDPATMASYFALWIFLAWFWSGAHRMAAFRSMWIATWTGRPAYAALHSTMPLPWAVLLIGAPILGTWLQHYPVGEQFEFMVMIFLFPLGSLAVYGSAAKYREKLSEELPDIACSPMPRRGDARFARWDPDKIQPAEQWRNWIVGGRVLRRRVSSDILRPPDP